MLQGVMLDMAKPVEVSGMECVRLHAHEQDHESCTGAQ